MTFLSRLPQLFGALGIACLCLSAVPLVYAAELEGTVVTTDVTTDGSTPVQVQIDSSFTASTGSSEHQQWQQEQQDFAREQQDFAREQQDFAREHQEQALKHAEQVREQAAQIQQQATAQIGHPNWEKNWEANLKDVFENKDDHDDGFNPAILIPLFAILFIFGGPVILLILLLVFLFGSKRRRQRDINMNIDKLLANGRDIPIELLRGDEPKSADDSGNQAKGIRNICLGGGWLVFLTIAFGIKIGAIGFIWIGLGISQVLIWYLNRPSANALAATPTDTQAGAQD